MVSPNFPRRYDAAVDSDAVALRNVSLDLPGCCIVEGGAYMKETDRIVDQLRRAYEGEAWHGPSVREVLEGVTASQASARPIASAHSIWEIVLHIAAWEDIVRRRLGAEKLQVTPEMDWPPVKDSSAASWAKALEDLKRGHLALRETIAAYDLARLDEKPQGGSTAYVLMHGAIQHDLYHAGQIAVLKKGT